MKGAIPLSANSNTSGWECGENLKEEENRMHQQNRNMQREKEENWSMTESMQQCDWYGFNLVKVSDKQKFSVIKATKVFISDLLLVCLQDREIFVCRQH